MKARVRAFAAAETENLRLIESAKAQFSRANPGVALTAASQLFPFCRMDDFLFLPGV